MKDIIIKKLTAELKDDYLDFFDNRAFSDGNPNGPCYCTSPNQDEETIKQMVSEFQENGVKKTVRKYAVDMLDRGIIKGYLAFDNDLSIGWCNAADIDSYEGFVPDFARENKCVKTIAIVCFEIAPGYRGKGIASAFIEQVCIDAKASGYVAVEGYAKIYETRNEFDFTGPVHLYEKAGFSQVMERNGQAIMRKIL
ncbi:GNAT family N-acetyltransferase [Butyrivibrio sp. INlla21]|uniref:GNAT family N-acetyltransferase n=1 Tax=Butyrivibrio sp. INlla21 TaxID=1520811 RepID=UPI0008ED3C9C|nr:GNAT family N-acetyltransferase [Butyrivibrio sp. INlla21]SFV03550.1 Acetyltransferase (GNAT) family protein [Butyrivibrio sp. INlla21]